jgi:hypothetical protein
LPESTWDTHRDGPTFPDKIAEELNWLLRMPQFALALQPGVIPSDPEGVERGAKKKYEFIFLARDSNAEEAGQVDPCRSTFPSRYSSII